MANGPIALMQMEKSGPIGRLMSAGERLSNLAYHVGQNKADVDDRLRQEFRDCQKAWDDATRECGELFRKQTPCQK